MMRQDEERDQIATNMVQIVTEAGKPLAPKQLVSVLRGQGFKEDKIRAVMWFLLDRDKLDLTKDWMLTLYEVDSRQPVPVGNHRKSAF